MTIVIRDATVEDKGDIVELIKEFAREWEDESLITTAFVERYLVSPSDFVPPPRRHRLTWHHSRGPANIRHVLLSHQTFGCINTKV